AREVAKWFGTAHRDRIFDLSHMRDLGTKILNRLDEPLGDASILPTYMVSAFAREQVTVCLSGDGGDELFAGYDPFGAFGRAQIYGGLVPGLLFHFFRWLAPRLPKSGRNMTLVFKFRRAFAGLSPPPPFWNPIWMAPVEPRDMAELFDKPLDL